MEKSLKENKEKLEKKKVLCKELERIELDK